MSKRIVYLVTTEGCESCKIMESILNKAYSANLYTFTPEVVNFKDVPNWIQTCVPLTDFPTLIFVEDNVIKYHISGTVTFKELINIVKDINFG